MASRVAGQRRTSRVDDSVANISARQPPSWLAQHLVWIITVAWTGVVSLKALRVSHGDWVVAATLLSTGNSLLGLAATAFYLTLSIGFPLLAMIVFLGGMYPSNRLAKIGLTYAITLLVIIVSTIVAPLYVAVPIVVLGFVIVVLRYFSLEEKAWWKRTYEWMPSGLLWLMLLAAVFAVPTFMALNDSAWHQPETLHMSNGTSTVGYVIRQEGDWFTVLRDKDRVLLYVRGDSVTERRTCSVTADDPDRTLREIIIKEDPPTYPLCTTLTKG